MSYDIQIFTIEIMKKYELSRDDEFFKHTDNLVKFSDQQFEDLKDRLISYDYELVSSRSSQLEFRRVDSTAQALLTYSGLYFSSGFDQDDIFEISMTASEFTDTGEFAKYDPQSGEWEV